MPLGQILIHTQNFTIGGTLVFVAQSVRRWAVEKLAGSTLAYTRFLHLTTRQKRRVFFFLFQLLIIFSSKSKTDSPSQENQQL